MKRGRPVKRKIAKGKVVARKAAQGKAPPLPRKTIKRKPVVDIGTQAKRVARKTTKRKISPRKTTQAGKVAHTPPQTLTAAAGVDEWTRRMEAGFDGDPNMLAAYCAAIQRAADADAVIATIKAARPESSGLMLVHNGKASPNPMVAIKEAAERHAMMIGKALGFTPDRSDAQDGKASQNGAIW